VGNESKRAAGRSYAAIAADFARDDLATPGLALGWYAGTVTTIERRAKNIELDRA
jgi:hypothetical protein